MLVFGWPELFGLLRIINFVHLYLQVNELWKEQMEKIRVNAEELYCIIKKLFSPPEDGTNFGIYFQNIIDDFRNSTKDMPKEDVLQLVIDPTSN